MAFAETPTPTLTPIYADVREADVTGGASALARFGAPRPDDTFTLYAEELIGRTFSPGEMTAVATGSAVDVLNLLGSPPPEDISERGSTFQEQPTSGDSNDVRLRLLARQYVLKNLSPEERARLAIVTDRVDALYPHFSPEEAALLDELDAQIAERRARSDRVAASLGID